jgi:hypothetical protein
MTDDSIEAKARDMVRKEDKNGLLNFDAAIAALCRASEQHEAFKQKVSDAAEEAQSTVEILCQCARKHVVAFNRLDQFIIPKPKPDPLVEIMEVLNGEWTPDEYAKTIRAKLDALGFEIREKGQ